MNISSRRDPAGRSRQSPTEILKQMCAFDTTIGIGITPQTLSYRGLLRDSPVRGAVY